MSSVLVSLQTNLKLLSDPVRLRLCALLARNELAVQELVAITGLQQSRVSNHLSLLKRAGLVRDRREGTWSFHSLVEPGEDSRLSPQLFAATIQSYLDAEAGKKDAMALAAVLDRRRNSSREMHDRLAGQWQDVGQEFALGTLRSEIVGEAWPCGPSVADLGCGAGFLANWLADRGATVIAVDHSEGMLASAREHARPGVHFRRGELDELPLQDCEVEAAFSNLVWHHVPDHDAAAREVFRVLKPGGRVVIADLAPHDRDWMREAMGDLRLGLKPQQILGALVRAGFTDLHTLPARDRYRVAQPGGETVEFTMFLVRGRKPGAAAPPS
jgi:ArsR family transcriptional regulator